MQGIDYAYTLQGWLKGINSAVLNPAVDIGKDGNGFSTTFGRVARDVYGFTLGYYNNDYSPIGGTGASLGLNYSFGSPDPSSTGSALFNGNISNTTLALNKFDTGAVAGYTYGYDQLNRLTQMNRHTPTVGSATWDNSSIIDAYKEQVSYDANGNILKYFRNGQANALSMDDLSYKYKPGSNQLDHVDDAVLPGNYSTDIDDQDTLNCQYDNIGNLKKDVAGGIDTVRWTVYGKINRVVKNTDGTAIDYNYDAAGNRTMKEVAAHDTLTQTYYVRDASGNVMAVYSKQNVENLKWSEQYLYASNRLGMLRIDSFIATNPPNVNTSGVYDELLYGKRNYELTNHLGNVLATISDKKIGHLLNDTTIDYFNADVVSANDYYPFGMRMPGRSFHSNTESYRYGFQSQETSTEISDNLYNAQYWEYDSRIGRRWNIDPITKPWESPYEALANSPLVIIDPNGDDGTPYKVRKGDNLSNIAKQFGTTVSSLAKINNLSNQNKIKIGQILFVGSQETPKEAQSLIPHNMSYGELTRTHPQVALAASQVYESALTMYSGSYSTYSSVSSNEMNNLTENQKQKDFVTSSPKTTGILLWEFLTGTGKSNRSFSQSNPITQDIMNSESSRLAAWDMAGDFQNGKFNDGDTKTYYIGMADGIGALEAIRRHINAYVASPASFYRGGMSYTMTRRGNDVLVKVTDAYTVYSMIRVNETIERIPGQTTPLGKTTVEFNFTWKDALKK